MSTLLKLLNCAVHSESVLINELEVLETLSLLFNGQVYSGQLHCNTTPVTFALPWKKMGEKKSTAHLYSLFFSWFS